MAPASGSQPGAIDASVAAWRYLVPNFFTACSAALGLVACFLAVEGVFIWAAWCILWCVLLDKADGTAARLLNSTSAFGMQFDSMADLISFGVAPAVLVYMTGRQLWGFAPFQVDWWLLATGCGLFTMLAAIRLARFNSRDVAIPSGLFAGIPSTLCGALVPAAVLIALKYNLGTGVVRFLPVAMGLLGLGMVSSIPIPKVTRRTSRAMGVFQLVNVIAVYLFGILTIFPEYILALSLTYLVVGGGWGLLKAQQHAGTD